MATTTKVIGIIGMTYKGGYDNATTYNKLQVVTYRNSSYVCKVDTVLGTLPTDTTAWGLLNKGLYYAGTWADGTYGYLDMVTYNNLNYMCVVESTTAEPTTSNDWITV